MADAAKHRNSLDLTDLSFHLLVPLFLSFSREFTVPPIVLRNSFLPPFPSRISPPPVSLSPSSPDRN